MQSYNNSPKITPLSALFCIKIEKSCKKVWQIDLNQLPLHRYPEYNLFTLKTNTY